MGTKKLSRTAIEGGRINGYKFERKQSLRSARRKANLILVSERDGDEVFPERDKSSYYPSEKFKDKINPVERWLDEQVGKSWDKTYSSLRERFDSRTTAGRHIVFDHILNDVWTSQDHSAEEFKRYSYYVDAQGILQKNEKRFDDVTYRRQWKEKEIIVEWLNRRLVGKLDDDCFYWFEPNRPFPDNVKCIWTFEGIQFKIPSTIWSGAADVYCTSFHQAKKLNKEEINFLNKLSVKNRNWLLMQSPLLVDYSVKSSFRRW